MLGGGVKNDTVSVCVSVCVCVYNFFGRTTGRFLMSDSSFDRKCPREKIFTIVDIDFFRKSISIDRYIIDFRSINVSIFDIFEYGRVAYHTGSVFGPEHESGIHFSKFDIDRSIYRFSVDPYFLILIYFA